MFCRLIRPNFCLRRCAAAVNGGVFSWSQGIHTPLSKRCALGVVVCNGSAWSSAPPPEPVFAVSNSCDIYVGNFPYSLFAAAGIVHAVSGQAVIVRNGTARVSFSSFSRSNSRPSTVLAPRTALGHDLNGRIMTLQVDGDESSNTGVNYAMPISSCSQLAPRPLQVQPWLKWPISWLLPGRGAR
jgi:exopolysaccharide biosynthesis protein